MSARTWAGSATRRRLWPGLRLQSTSTRSARSRGSRAPVAPVSAADFLRRREKKESWYSKEADRDRAECIVRRCSSPGGRAGADLATLRALIGTSEVARTGRCWRWGSGRECASRHGRSARIARAWRDAKIGLVRVVSWARGSCSRFFAECVKMDCWRRSGQRFAGYAAIFVTGQRRRCHQGGAFAQACRGRQRGSPAWQHARGGDRRIDYLKEDKRCLRVDGRLSRARPALGGGTAQGRRRPGPELRLPGQGGDRGGAKGADRPRAGRGEPGHAADAAQSKGACDRGGFTAAWAPAIRDRWIGYAFCRPPCWRWRRAGPLTRRRRSTRSSAWSGREAIMRRPLRWLETTGRGFRVAHFAPAGDCMAMEPAEGMRGIWYDGLRTGLRAERDDGAGTTYLQQAERESGVRHQSLARSCRGGRVPRDAVEAGDTRDVDHFVGPRAKPVATGTKPAKP